MLIRHSGICALIGVVLAIGAAAVQAQAPAPPLVQPRVTAMYTTWDSYYFYAGFQVSDHNVVSTNQTPNSEPQQDDDIEVFFDTDNTHATVRTPDTYQMAISAGNGAYFSVGTGTAIPKPEVVYTYKYAAIVDGPLNKPDGTDIGYSIELAIPWAELGMSGPPADGTTWGFNVISRDRTSTTLPASKFYSLSPLVTTGPDVQDPADWSQITFTTNGVAPSESVDHVYCPHTTLGQYPVINGQVTNGKWPASSQLSFGTVPVVSPAPTTAQEPNTTQSPFTELPATKPAPPLNTTAVPQPVPITAPAVSQPSQTPDTISLPGGGSIKIVPGGIKHPQGFSPAPPPPISPNSPFTNPLALKVPQKYQAAYEGSNDDNDIAPPLGKAVAPRLIMALYRIDYNGDTRLSESQGVWAADGDSLLFDQPINGAGPWFSGLRPNWHRQQFTDMRRAGIDIALLQLSSADPMLGRELDAMVEALKEMRAAGDDYPLLALSTASASSTDVTAQWNLHVPEQFRADVVPDDIANASIVTPGGLNKSKLIARDDGDAYKTSWQAAQGSTQGDVILDSWDDFTHGTELAATRQYGDSYIDDTHLQTVAFNGNQQWHAKYLKAYVPKVILTRTLYQVPVRIENAGTLPWRAGEGYSLCSRWYDKNGMLASDAAARVPIAQEVLPGQAATLSLGIAARNGYGGDLPPGNYTLVIDVVQGQDQWFTFAGDHPLQIPVQVVAVDDPSVQPSAEFIGTTTAPYGASGETLTSEVDVRNDGPKLWPPGDGKADYSLLYKIDAVAEDGTLTQIAVGHGQPLSPVSVLPGEVARPQASVALVDSDDHGLKVGQYELHWFVQAPDGHVLPGQYDESIAVTASDPGDSFVLSDVPRTVGTGQTFTAKLAVVNLSGETWAKGDYKIGYHWYSLDGVEQQWSGGKLTPLAQAVTPGQTDGTVAASVRAPDQPGRYSLTFDMVEPNGQWASISAPAKGDGLMPMVITVTGDGSDVPVDLAKDAAAGTSDFDGHGDGFPEMMLPPDGTAEVVANPLEMIDLIDRKPGPPLYPDGYYSSNADHSMPFLYPLNIGTDGIVSCQGQTISLPGGNYREIHILAAANGDDSVNAQFMVGGTPISLDISPWTVAPTGALIGYASPDEVTPDGLVANSVMLGDYVLKLGQAQHLDRITLPNSPSIRIVAITLVK